ncbi:MAG: HisA/HisF-related TIM barrel protein [Ilumatobacteraceae bacterium]
MQLFPAIDLLNGKVVRLSQGDYNASTEYGDDPSAVARSFVDAGAEWIHIVDLNAARGEGPVNRQVISSLASEFRGAASIQTGGGVRSVEDVRQLHETGVERAVMGSAAIRQPDLVELCSDVLPIAVGLDHRDGFIALEGWTESSTVHLSEALGRYPTASAFVITDISRDGMLSGPDVEGLSAASAATSIPVIASGGVSSLDDLRALATISGLAGIIAGKAIYEGRFSVSEAVEVLR